MIDGQNFFNQPAKNNFRTYDNIWKISTGQRDYYVTSCLLGYNYFNRYYKMIAIDKQQALDVDRKTIKQIYFTGNLEREENVNTTMFFIIEEAKEGILDFSQRTVRAFWMILAILETLFWFNVLSV